MSIYDELAAIPDPRTQEPPAPITRGDAETEFGKGLRAGTAGLSAQGNAFLGSAGRALGFNDFAAGRDAASAQAQQEAEAAQAQLKNPTFDSVKGIGDFGNFALGQVGQLAPAVGGGVVAGIGGGLAAGPLGALAAGTAAFTPFEAGGIAQRMAQDPAAQALSPQEQFGRQLAGGAVSSLAQNIVPAAFGGKLIGQGAGAAAKRTLGQTVGVNLAEGVIGQGVGGGVGEAVRQQAINPDKPFDTGEIKDAAIANAVVGVPLAGVGIAGDVLQGTPRKAFGAVKDAATATKEAVTNSPAFAAVDATARDTLAAARAQLPEDIPGALRDGVDFLKGSIQERAAATKAGIKEIMEADDVPAEIKARVTELGKNIGDSATQAYVYATQKARQVAKATEPAVDGMGDLLKTLKGSGEDAVAKIAAGKPLGDAQRFAVEQGDALTQLVKDSTDKAIKVTNDLGKKLADRLDLSPEQRKAVADGLADINNAAGRAKVATVALAARTKDKITALAKGAKEGYDAAVASKGGAKKSEDFSGYSKFFESEIVPTIAESNPELLTDAKSITELGSALRNFAQLAAEGKDDRLVKLHNQLTDVLGSDTANDVLARIHERVTKDPEKSAKFFSTLQGLLQEDQTNNRLADAVKKYLPEGDPTDPKALAAELMKFNRGEYDKGKTREEQAFNRERVNVALEVRFGKNLGRVQSAIEKEIKATAPKVKLEDTPQGAGLESDASISVKDGKVRDGLGYVMDTDSSRYDLYEGSDGAGGLPKLYDSPETAQGKSGFASATTQALDRLSARHPESKVQFVRLSDYAKSAGMSPEQIAAVAKGKNPSDVGFIKVEKTDATDGVQPYQLRATQMEKKFQTRENGKGGFEDNPSLVRVLDEKGSTTAALDSRRIAGAFKAEGDTAGLKEGGLKMQIAQKFVEGLAKLQDHYGQKGGRINVRDDQVIGTVAGKDFTYGEATALLKRRDTVGKDVGTKAERMTREYIPELNDRELKSFTDKVTTALQAREDLLRDEVYAELKQQKLSQERFKQEFAAQLAERSKDEATRIPELRRVLSKAEYEADRRAGQDRRTEILNNELGSTTRDGIDVNRLTAASGKEGQAKAVQDYVASLNERREKFESGKAPEVEKPNTGSGRTQGDPEGQIHDAAALIKAADLVRYNEGLTGYKAEPLFDGAKDITPAGEDVVKSKLRGLQNSVVGERRAVARDVVALLKNGKSFEKPDRDLLHTSVAYLREKGQGGIQIEQLKQAVSYLKDKYDVEGKPAAARATKGAIERNPVRFDRDGKVVGVEGPGDPKALAAKKAALLEAASSSDPALLRELGSSSDVKGLQRAVEALADAPTSPGAEKALKTASERLSELFKDEGNAYNAQTKRYSLESTAVHEDLGRSGFAATHDSPTRHEGFFDWRKHSGSGEGNASFGAGTYLSTAEGVHKSYKKQFTAKSGASEFTWGGRKFEYDRPSEEIYVDGVPIKAGSAEESVAYAMFNYGLPPKEALSHARDSVYRVLDRSAEDIKNSIDLSEPNVPDKDLAYLFTALEGRKQIDADKVHPGLKPFLSVERWNRMVEAGNRRALALADLDVSSIELPFGGKSPTYHVSVDIAPEHLLDWGKSIAEQSGFVRDKLERGLRSFGLDVKGASGEHTSGSDAYRILTQKLGSQAKASDYLQSLGVLGHRYNADGGKNEARPNYVIYDDSKIGTNYVSFEKSSADRPKPYGKETEQKVLDAIGKLLGKNQAVEFADIPHAGEYDPVADVIRISKLALNPTSTAYHEALHGFFKHLRDQGNDKVIQVLERATSKPEVIAQLEKFLEGKAEALAQLKDPEERVAYAFQLFQRGKLTLDAPATTFFGKLKETLLKVLGIWSNDRRAMETFKYFSEGKFADNIGNRTAVADALIKAGRNETLDAVSAAAKPFVRLGEEIVGAGSANLRDSGIPALAKIADLVKAKGTDQKTDAGFLPASRVKRTEFLNQLATVVEGKSEEHLADALKALQTGTVPIDKELRATVEGVKGVLQSTRDYLVDAKVNIGDLGPDYFPRQWDPSYLVGHRKEFMAMMAKYPQVKDPDALYAQLVNADGAELQVVDRPGLTAKKERLLAFVQDADAEPFLSKNLLRTVDSYLNQASRRGEWAKRFGDNNSVLSELMDEARSQGATAEQLSYVGKYVRGVNGTLGDDFSPQTRRLFGNAIVYQNLRLLPLAIFSQVVDPMGVMVRGGTIGDAWRTFTRGIKEIPAGLKGEHIHDASTKLAEDLGTIENAMLQHALGSSYTQGIVGDTGRKINDLFFRFNLVEQANRSFRVGATEAATRFILRHADGSASPHSRRWIGELGLKESDVKTTADGRLAVSEADGLTAEQAARVRSAVNQWVDGAVLRPDAADKPVWFNDPRFMLISHLKQFTYAFHHTILSRVAHEVRNGNFAPAMALMSYVPVMIAADFVKGMIQGGGEQPDWKKGWGPTEYVAHGIERAGLYGVGQFGVDALQDVGRGGIGVAPLLGPTLEQLGDAVGVLGGKRQFGPVFLDSLPANDLYSAAFGGSAGPGPIFTQ